MGTLLFSRVLKAAIIAGVVAGLVVSVFHLVATEPLIDQAIAIEELRAHEGGHHDEGEAIISREVQRYGLVLGFLLYGLTWSVLLSAGFYVAQRWLPVEGFARRGWLVAALAYWSVGLFPLLKYPASPPGVGDPETVTYRQTLFLASLALSVTGSAIAVLIARRQGRGPDQAQAGWLAGLGFLIVFALATYALLPGNPDPVEMPPDLVTNFRLLSTAGITIFWAVLGGLFGWQLGRAERGTLGVRS